MLLADLLGELGVPGVELRLGSLGSLDARARLPGGAEGAPARARGRALRGRARADRRQPAARLRLRRRGDAGGDGERADDRRARSRARTPSTSPRCGRCSTRPAIAYAIDPTLVRGLDYYTRTIFSFVCDALGAQSEIGGGGRYDGLIEQLGGPATPAVGWAAGIERILLALDEEERAGRARRLRRRRRRRSSGGGRWRWRPSCATPGSRPRSTSPAAASRASSSTPTGSAPAGSLILEADGSAQLRDMASGEQRAVDPGNLVDEMTGGELRERGIPALRANGYRDTWCGQVLGDRVDSEVRVAGWVHRRRDHGGLIFIDLRDRTGIVQLVFHPDSSGEAFELGPQAARRGRAQRRRARWSGAPPETVNPELPTGEVELKVERRRAARRRRDAALPDRGLLRRGRRGRAPAPPLPRPAPRADARGADAAPPGHRGDARVPRRRGLPRRRDAGADPLDPGGRPRLPRPQPPPAGLLLRAAAVAAAVQAAADGRRLRALLPDRPLLPRRGPARRPPARVHPARHRDVLRRRRRRDRGQRTAAGPRLRARRRARSSSCRCSGMPYDEAMAPLRHRPARPALRAGAGRPRRRPARDRVQGLPLGARRRRRGPRPQRRPARDAALGARRADLARPGAGRQGPGLGLPRGRRLALADRQVPQRGGAGRRSTSGSAPRRATCCCSSPTSRKVADAVLGQLRLDLGRALRPDRPRTTTSWSGSSTGR